MIKRSRKNERDHVLDILLNKYQTDPDRFRSYLPELLPEVDDQSRSSSKRGHVSTLTEIERERLCELLLKIPRDKPLTEQQAIQVLGYCATLIQDENLPDEIDRKTTLMFLHRLIGAPISKISRTTEKSIRNGKAAKTVAVLRGVHLHLTWDDLPVAVSISPAKFKERSQALKFVGIGQDPSPDVSSQHDAYLGGSMRCRSQKE